MYPAEVRPPVVPPSASTEPSTAAPYCLTPVQQQALAERYAPILYFHPDEQNFLQDPNTYIDQSSLRQERDFWGDKEVHGLGEVPSGELAGIGKDNEDADGQLFLDHQNEELGDGIRTGDLANSNNLYQYDSATNTITYHLFYSYNDGPPGLGDVQNHEGDWEKITVQLDSNFQRWKCVTARTAGWTSAARGPMPRRRTDVRCLTSARVRTPTSPKPVTGKPRRPAG